MNLPRLRRLLPGCLIFGFLGLLIGGGCMSEPSKTRNSSSVVSYLYPGKDHPLPPTTIPVLRLLLRVGIAFVPSGNQNYFGGDGISEMQKSALLLRVANESRGRECIEAIEIIPS